MITAVNLTAGEDLDDATSHTTASITPSANKLILATVGTRKANSINPNTPTITGCGLTWVLVNSTIFDNSGTSRRGLYTFRAMGPSPTAGALTIDWAGQTQTDVMFSVDEFTGVDRSGTNGSGAIVQSVVNQWTDATHSDLTVTLAAFSSPYNATFGAFADAGSDVGTVGSGFTQIGQNGDALDSIMVVTEFKSSNDTTVDYTFSIANEKGGIAIELKEDPSNTMFFGTEF